MSDWLRASRSGYDRVTIPTIWVALALSLLFHVAVLWVWLPQMHNLSLESLEHGNASGPLVVQLAAPPSEASTPTAPPSTPELQARPFPAHRTPPPKAVPRPSSTPPVVTLSATAPASALPPAAPSLVAPTSTIALPPPTPSVVAPPPAIVPPPPPPSVAAPAPAIAQPSAQPSVAAPAAPAVEGDLSSYIEARRRAREGTAPPSPQVSASSAPRAPPIEDETERRNRIIAANLGLQRAPTFGYDPKGGGGIFEILRLGSNDAEFVFFGWNKDIRRNSKQLIEVAKGGNSDIRIAVVRRMIAIIRDNESGDFVWVSQRLGRSVTLSARPSDNAGLEDFMMEEFFSDPRRRY